jgi:tetratricopeptide (TPR) repeat protein
MSSPLDEHAEATGRAQATAVEALCRAPGVRLASPAKAEETMDARASRECLGDDDLAAFVDGRLVGAELEAIEAHVDRCAPCRRLMAMAAHAERSTGAEGDALPSSGELAPASLGRGALVGRYVVLERIGEGGMGVVYAAFDPELERRIALKVLRRELTRDPAAVAAVRGRLVREAQAMARLSHPNVIAVYDVGTHDGEVFLAMELVDGGTLRAFIDVERARGSLDPARVLELFVRAGEGLAAAHEKGIVHRDFKPDNVLLGKDGRVRVSDFGLAREALATHRGGDDAEDPWSTITRSGLRVGTPAYMAPEQHDGAATDPRTDQFAFAVGLYEALFGGRPFQAKSVRELAERVRRGEIRKPPKVAGVTVAVERAILRALAPNPSARHPSMVELLSLLRPPAPRWRPAAIAVAAIAALSIAVAVGSRPAPAAPASPCASAARASNGGWSGATREKARAAFAAVNRPFAARAFEEADRELSRYEAELASARVEACTATRVRGEESEALLDLTSACLDRKALALDALGDVLASADDELVARAPEAARSLPSLHGCARSRLAGRTAPVSGAAAASVTDVERALGEAQALIYAGRYPAALAAAERAAGGAEAEGGYLRAEVLMTLGRAEELCDHDDDAERTLREAAWAGEAAHADDVVAAARAYLAYLSGYQRDDGGNAEDLAREADAAIARLGGDDVLEADLWHTRGATAFKVHRDDEAIEDFDRALAIADRGMKDRVYVRATLLDSKAAALADRGDLGASLALSRSVVEAYEKLEGPDHPDVGRALDSVGQSLWALGRADEGLVAMRRTLAIREAAFQPGTPQVAMAHSNVAELLRSAGRPDEALLEVDEALTDAGADSVEPTANIGLIRAVRGSVLFDLGRLDEADAELRLALTVITAALGEDDSQAALCHNELGRALLAKKRIGEARVEFQKAFDIERAVRTSGHVNLAYGLHGLGACALAERAPARALAPLEQALALRESREGDPLELAETRFALARAIWDAGGDRSRAVALAAAAAEALATRGPAGAALARDIEAWRATHRAS